MATNENGIFGQFIGKVGGVVGTTWRGIPVVKIAPKKSSKEPSLAQLLQRAKFSAVVAFLHPLKPFLLERFGKMEGSRSPYDLAISYHLKEALKVEGDLLVMDYPKVCISKGHLRGLEGASLTLVSENVLELQWLDNSNQSFARGRDGLTIILFVPSVGSFFFFENIALRQNKTGQFTLPEEAVGTDFHCWATFVDDSGSQAATSFYIPFAG